jgi:soluble lytic murein transglycosylase-like protein
MKTFCISLFFLLIGISAHADIYQTVTDEGTVVYTNLSHSGSKTIAKEKAIEQKSTPRTPKDKNHGIGAFQDIAEEKAMKHNVDPKLVKAVINAESNWNPKAVSQKGALGMMQLMPKTASDMGVGNPLNAEENIEGGVKYLRWLIDRFRGNLSLAIAAYNAGPSTVEKFGGIPSIPETLKYVRRVMNEYSGGSPVDWSTGSGAGAKIRRVVLMDGTTLITNIAAASHSY